MCTVTWLHDDDGYQLFCNRDEKLTRKPALPPRLAVRDGVSYLAPVDGDFGGTWIATNEFGLTTCVLNGANVTGTESHCTIPLRSRGLLLLDLIPLSSISDVCEHVGAIDLSRYAPFTLVALKPGKPAAVIEWNRSHQTTVLRAEPHFMLTSSSFDTEAVRLRRRELYMRIMPVTSEALRAFHRSHGHQPSAYSPCMHRPDAETVSFSWIRVSPDVTTFHYTPAAPCQRLHETTPSSGFGLSGNIVRNSNRLPSGS